MDHDALDPVAVFVHLAGHLLGGGQHRLDLAEVDRDDALLGQHVVRLDHAGDQVTVPADVLAEVHLVGRLAQPLQDHLLGRHRGDPAEVMRGVVHLADHRAVLVQLLGVHGGRAGGPVDLDPGVRIGAFGVPVRGQQRGLDRRQDRLERDLTLALKCPEDREVDVHSPPSSSCSSSNSSKSSSARPASSATSPSSGSGSSPPGRRNSSCTCPAPSSVSGTSRRWPSGSSSVTPDPSAAITRAVTDAVPTRTLTSLPTARRQCRGSVSGRSTPGELISNWYSPGKISPASCSARSSALPSARARSEIRSWSTPPSWSTTTRTTYRRPAGSTVRSSRSQPTAAAAGSATARTLVRTTPRSVPPTALGRGADSPEPALPAPGALRPVSLRPCAP